MHKLVSLYIKTTKVVTLIMTRSPTTNGNWTPFILVETGTGWSSFLVFSCKRVSIAKWMMYNINLHKKVGSVSRNTPQQIVHIHIPFYQNKNLASVYVVCLMRCEMIYMRLQRKLHNGSLNGYCASSGNNKSNTTRMSLCDSKSIRPSASSSITLPSYHDSTLTSSSPKGGWV
jgi:hypothetical protein